MLATKPTLCLPTKSANGDFGSGLVTGEIFVTRVCVSYRPLVRPALTLVVLTTQSSCGHFRSPGLGICHLMVLKY